jgi:hypothetical protein
VIDLLSQRALMSRRRWGVMSGCGGCKLNVRFMNAGKPRISDVPSLTYPVRITELNASLAIIKHPTANSPRHASSLLWTVDGCNASGCRYLNHPFLIT